MDAHYSEYVICNFVEFIHLFFYLSQIKMSHCNKVIRHHVTLRTAYSGHWNVLYILMQSGKST